jgi:hypothetical protein
VVDDLATEKVDRYLTRDAQRIIEAIETCSPRIRPRRKTSMRPWQRGHQSDPTAIDNTSDAFLNRN